MVFFSAKVLEKSLLPAFQKVRLELEKNGVEISFLHQTKDIWCRDYMPVKTGTNEFTQFFLSPGYYQTGREHLITDPFPICRELGIAPSVPKYEGNNIYLEGGNVILGYGKAIICDKVVDDNKVPPTKLIQLLKEALKVELVIFIPQEPGEYTGHSDGMVRFLNEHTVLANNYVRSNSGKRFREQFYCSLKEAGFDILTVPYSPVDSDDYNQPATGCYINFLQVGQKIFLPTFNDRKNDELAFDRFCEIYGSGNVVKVPSLPFAQLGGVLNCMSWES